MSNSEAHNQPSVRDIKARFESESSSHAKPTHVQNLRNHFDRKPIVPNSKQKPAIPQKPKLLPKPRTVPPPPVPRHATPSHSPILQLPHVNALPSEAASTTNGHSTEQNHTQHVPSTSTHPHSACSMDSQAILLSTDDDLVASYPVSEDDTRMDEPCSGSSSESDDLPISSRLIETPDESPRNSLIKTDTLHTSVINEMKRNGFFTNLAGMKIQLPSHAEHVNGYTISDDELIDTEEVRMRVPDAPTPLPKYNNENNSKSLENIERLVLEICMKEEFFVKMLSLMVRKYPEYLTNVEIKSNGNRQSKYHDVVNEIVVLLSPILMAHEEFLRDLTNLVVNENGEVWDSRTPKLANVFLRNVDFLQLCLDYILNKQKLCEEYGYALQNNKALETATRKFERQVMNDPSVYESRFSNMYYTSPVSSTVKPETGVTFIHQMDLVHQNFVRYKMFIDRYINELKVLNFKDELMLAEEVQKKLIENGNKMNEKLKFSEAQVYLMELQARFGSSFEVIKPDRRFIKEGRVKRQARKGLVDRLLYLFSDIVLLCHTDFEKIYEISVLDMEIKVDDNVERDCWFELLSPVKSAAYLCSTKAECKNWVDELKRAQNNALEVNRRRQTTSAINAKTSFSALWIPDDDASMCMMNGCHRVFNVLVRRHHCRVCGCIICSGCNGFAPVATLGYDVNRVCAACYYEILDELKNGTLFPLSMIDSITDYNNSFSLNMDQRIKFKDGKLKPIKDLFTAPRNGQKLRSQRLDDSPDYAVHGKMWLKNETRMRYARLSHDDVLFIYAARYDVIYERFFDLRGFKFTTRELKDDRHEIKITMKNSKTLEIFIPSKSFLLWEKTLTEHTNSI